MSRIPREPLVGIRLDRAVLCPNDDTVYDAQRFRDCPTCQGEERVYLSRCLASEPKAAARPSLGGSALASAPWPPARPRRIAVL